MRYYKFIFVPKYNIEDRETPQEGWGETKKEKGKEINKDRRDASPVRPHAWDVVAFMRAFESRLHYHVVSMHAIFAKMRVCVVHAIDQRLLSACVPKRPSVIARIEILSYTCISMLGYIHVYEGARTRNTHRYGFEVRAVGNVMIRRLDQLLLWDGVHFTLFHPRVCTSAWSVTSREIRSHWPITGPNEVQKRNRNWRDRGVGSRT